MTLRMPEAYTPSAPNGVGTDDYRCFLLDPHLTQDTFLTGTIVLPGNPDVVHHVILFRVAARPGRRRPRQQDAADAGRGLDLLRRHAACRTAPDLDDAPWLGAWAPGGHGVGRRARASATPLAAGLAGSSCRSTTTCSAGPARTARRPSSGWRPATDGPHAAGDDAAAGAGRAALPARATPTARCATATRPSPTSMKRFGAGRATTDNCCTCCADRAEARPRCSPAPARSPSRRRSAASPATCTCSAGRSRSRSTPARPSAQDRAGHPGLGLRQPGRQADQAGAR